MDRIDTRQSLVCPRKSQNAFTIVELLVVIVVIGILASITIISYTGITQRAITSTVKVDLINASKQLKVFQAVNGVFPITMNCGQADSLTNLCIKTSAGTSLQYNVHNFNNNQTFGLSATNKNVVYRLTDNSTPIPCSYNFIIVPGSATYGTSDFCVMKYGARAAGGGISISQAEGSPWVSITQDEAVTYSSNVERCTGCHLITEAEWLTIAQNVLKVPSNWTGGVVGAGEIFSGHNDDNPSMALEATQDDDDGYYLTGNNTPSNQRRTLTLSNGEIIWDFAGNIWEWTSKKQAGSLPGVSGGGFAWREWVDITTNGTVLPDPYPASTDILNSNTWTSAQGIGKIYSNSDDLGLKGFMRGGAWANYDTSGVLSLRLNIPPDDYSVSIGFRAAR